MGSTNKSESNKPTWEEALDLVANSLRMEITDFKQLLANYPNEQHFIIRRILAGFEDIRYKNLFTHDETFLDMFTVLKSYKSNGLFQTLRLSNHYDLLKALYTSHLEEIDQTVNLDVFQQIISLTPGSAEPFEFISSILKQPRWQQKVHLAEKDLNTDDNQLLTTGFNFLLTNIERTFSKNPPREPEATPTCSWFYRKPSEDTSQQAKIYLDALTSPDLSIAQKCLVMNAIFKLDANNEFKLCIQKYILRGDQLEELVQQYYPTASAPKPEPKKLSWLEGIGKSFFSFFSRSKPAATSLREAMANIVERAHSSSFAWLCGLIPGKKPVISPELFEGLPRPMPPKSPSFKM